jgi:peptidoglycan/LPS O-acetylase OafA/YrhL
MTGLGVFAGALLSDMYIFLNPSMCAPTLKISAWFQVFLYPMPALAIILGAIIMSFPEASPTSYPWAHGLNVLGPYISPAGADIRWYYYTIGPQIAIIGIIFSPMAQRLLSHRCLVLLGAMSFPTYLLHGPLLRSFGTWVLYIGVSPGTNNRLSMPSTWRVWLTAPIFWGTLLALAYWWTMYVEPWCGRVTKWLEVWMVGEREEKLPLASMADLEGRA